MGFCERENPAEAKMNELLSIPTRAKIFTQNTSSSLIPHKSQTCEFTKYDVFFPAKNIFHVEDATEFVEEAIEASKNGNVIVGFR